MVLSATLRTVLSMTMASSPTTSTPRMIHRLRWIADVSTGRPLQNSRKLPCRPPAGVVTTMPGPGTIDTEQDRIGIYSWGIGPVSDGRPPTGLERHVRLPE